MNEKLDPIPKWTQHQLSDVAKIIDPHPSHRAPDAVLEGVPFAGIGDLSERGELAPNQARIVPLHVLREHEARYRLSSNSIGFGRVASIGKVIDFRGDVEELTISPTMAVIEPFGIDRNFLVHSLRGAAVKEAIEKWLTGSTRSSLGIELLRQIPVRAPDRASQEKISAILTSISTAIEKTEALIAKYQQVKAGLMHDLLTRGVLPNGQLRPPREQAPELYQETEVGWIPKKWHTKLVREICSEIGDGVHYSVSRSSEGVPFLFVSCVRDGEIDWDTAARISPSTYIEISKKCKPYEGMILLTAVGSYGHAVHVQTNDAFGFERNIAYLKPNTDAVSSKYLYHWLTSSCATNQIERLVIGNAQKVLTLGNTGKIAVALPNEREQEIIVTQLNSVDRKVLSEKQKLNKLNSVKFGLMQDLLTGKVSVSVDAAALEPVDG